MVKSRMLLVSGLSALALGSSVNAKDAGLKVGWVSQSVVEQTEEGKLLGKQITEKQRTLAADLEAKQKLYTDAAEKLRAESSALSEEVRMERAEYVARLERDYREAAQKAERTMQMEVQKATQEAYKSFAVAAEQYAKEKGFDVMLSDAGAIYVNKDVDTSKDVAQIMNKNYEVKLAQNKGAEKSSTVKTAAAPAAKADNAAVVAKTDKDKQASVKA